MGFRASQGVPSQPDAGASTGDVGVLVGAVNQLRLLGDAGVTFGLNMDRTCGSSCASSSAAPPRDPPSGIDNAAYELFQRLKSQGANAKGGTLDYVINGRMIGGFAAIAYPADYGNSGIMSFMVNHEGVVYQKDLGDKTTDVAKAMTAFDPDATWMPTRSD